MLMPFGRHEGTEIAALPLVYLSWLATLSTLREPLKTAIHAELARRQAHATAPAATVAPCPDLGLAREVVSAGRRVVSKRCHPDLGGSHEAFVLLTRVGEWLEETIGAAALEKEGAR